MAESLDDRREDRRSALTRLVVAGLGAVTAALAGLVGLVAAPRTDSTTRRWRPVASLSDLPADAPHAAVVAERQADGWYQTRRQSVVYLDRDGDGVRALSATCSHLGCRVRWDDAQGQFRCPCHGGIYDRAGEVVSGPPPEPLRRVPVRVNPETSQIEVEL
ncbi:MAG: Rieske (2Fe-2S) protein [Vicinamibacterales bacterium]